MVMHMSEQFEEEEEVTAEVEVEKDEDDLGMLWMEDSTKGPGKACSGCGGKNCKGYVYLFICDKDNNTMNLGERCQLTLIGKLLRMWVKSVTGRRVTLRPFQTAISRPFGLD